MDTEHERQYASLKAELIEIATILEKYPEPIRPKVFDVLLSAYRGQLPAGGHASDETKKLSGDQPPAETETISPPSSDTNKDSKARKRASDTYSIDPDLKLHGGAGVPSFQKFVDEKQPSSNYEFNAVAVYYVTKLLKKPKATIKEAWTCYKEVKRRTPEFFKQSFTDTKNKAGYVKITDDFDLELSGRGENLVEHDLPAKKPDAKS
jgi:hypothetical protein